MKAELTYNELFELQSIVSQIIKMEQKTKLNWACSNKNQKQISKHLKDYYDKIDDKKYEVAVTGKDKEILYDTLTIEGNVQQVPKMSNEGRLKLKNFTKELLTEKLEVELHQVPFESLNEKELEQVNLVSEDTHKYLSYLIKDLPQYKEPEFI